MIEVTCRCGAVAIELEGEPLAQFYCHCDDCQIACSAPYIAVAAYPAKSVRVTRGDPSRWKLRITPRATCRECGTRLFAQRPGLDMCGVNGYLLPAFRPAFHVQCRFARLPVKDDLAHYASLPASFGGSDETVGW